MRKEFYTFHQAVLYQRQLKIKGIESVVLSAYSWEEQREKYVVAEKVR